VKPASRYAFATWAAICGEPGVSLWMHRVSAQWHLGPVARNHFALHDGPGLLGGFGGIVDERVGLFAGAERAV
jgi:hypothetical protein